MTVRTFSHEPVRKRARPVAADNLLRLGWPHFWLLTAILGGMLGLVALVMFAYRFV